MKKLFVILVTIAVIGGAMFGAYKVLGFGDSESAIGDTVQDIKEKVETVVNKEEDFSGSMTELMARGKSLRCTYKQTEEEDGVETEGIIYVADDNVRSEINILDPEEEGVTRMNMILNGDWVYVWTNVQAKGTKMKVVDLEGGEDFDANEDISDLEEEIEMKCRPWIKDSSKFKVPTDIEFQDITEMMEGFQGIDLEEPTEEDEVDVGAAKEFMCEMCKMAPTQEEIDQCLIDAECE